MARWPPSELQTLVAAGVLRQAGLETAVRCDGCEEACFADVEWADSEDGEPPRAYVVCAERDYIGRVYVPADRLVIWSVDLERLAELLAELLGIRKPVEELRPDRLWRLGARRAGDLRTEVFFVVGAAWPDAAKVFRNVGRLVEGTTPVVLVPSSAPNRRILRTAKAVSLTGLLSLGSGELELDVEEMDARITSRPERVPPSADILPVLVVTGTSVEYLGHPVPLPPLPLKLLTLLAERPGKAIENGRIAAALWGEAGLQYMDQIRQHVMVVNAAVRKVEPSPKRPPERPSSALIKARRGIGYYLTLRPPEVKIVESNDETPASP